MSLLLSGLSFLTRSRAGQWVGKALAGAVLVFGLLWKLKRDTRKQVELENTVDRLKGAIAADERMDHADFDPDASDDDNREWLRKRANRRRKPGS